MKKNMDRLTNNEENDAEARVDTTKLDKLARTGADKTCQQNFAVVFTIFGGGTSYSIIIEGATFFTPWISKI